MRCIWGGCNPAAGATSCCALADGRCFREALTMITTVSGSCSAGEFACEAPSNRSERQLWFTSADTEDSSDIL